MKKVVTLLFITALILFSNCNNQDDLTPRFTETVNLGTELTITNGLDCSESALIHISDKQVIIGASHPQLIDLTSQSVTDIAFNANEGMGYHLLQATETHLFYIVYKVVAWSAPEDFRLLIFNVATGEETILINDLGPVLDFVGIYRLGIAINDDKILYNKEATDSTIYLKNLYDGTPETILPVHGKPVYLSPSGRLFLYQTSSGYFQYDFDAEQSLFLHSLYIAGEFEVSSIFLIQDKPYITRGDFYDSQPVYLKNLSTGQETLISETGSNGGITDLKISPDEQYLSFWIYEQISDLNGGYLDVFELIFFDLSTKESKTIYKVEQQGEGLPPCNSTASQISVGFSPDGRKLTYMFTRNLYQFSLPV